MARRLFVLALALFLMASPLLAKDAPISLDQLPTSEMFRPRHPVGPDQFASEQAAFVQQVATQVKELNFHLTEQRIFVYTGVSPEMGPQWVVLHAELGNQLVEQFHAKELSRSLSEGGPAAISVWKLPHGRVVAIAESEDLPDGNALVGYFELEK